MARAEAEDAGRVKDEFLATLSHELRTPLNAILGWAHMLRDPALPHDRRQAAIDTIVRNAQSQEQLISDILDVQRIMAGKIRLSRRTVDLGAIIRSAAETVQPSATAKNIRLQLLVDLDVPAMWGDPDRLQQVVWNLLSNAIKFAPNGGHVQVRLLKDDSECELVVQDNGPGITRIHSVHVRALPAGRLVDHPHAQGTGPGTRDRAQPGRNAWRHHHGAQRRRRGRHRRHLHDSAAAPGRRAQARGSRMGPRARRTRRCGSTTRRRSTASACSWSKTIADARELIGAILERCGRGRDADRVRGGGLRGGRRASALTSSSATSKCRHEDGYSFIRRIRALAPDAGGDVPAAALTAYASPADRMKVLGAGFNIHVAKPVQPAELAMVVASLAGRRG